MDWKNRTPAGKAEYLSQQLKDIRRARTLLEHFERLTQTWLRRVEEAPKRAK